METMCRVWALAFVLLLSNGCSTTAHRVGKGEADTVMETSSLEPKAMCSGLKVVPSANGTWVPLHRPHGPCAASSSSTTGTPSLIEMKATGEDVLDPTKPQVDMMQSDYSPQSSFGIGTGSSDWLFPTATGDAAVSQTMAVDTSIDLPWIQCRPCPVPQCYPQRNPLFDPRGSATVYGNGCSGNNQCRYLISYPDGRGTAGTYMSDTLTISAGIAVKNFRFGCSHAVRGTFSDKTAGTMSLGGGPQSLRAQMAAAYGNAFSYCVPQPSSSGFLSLGGPADPTSAFARTPLVRNANGVSPTTYLVRLNVAPVVFSGGSIMDSSAVITQLPPTAYRALRQAFRNAMRAYPRRGNPVLDTCYDLLRFASVRVPEVSLVFDGGAVLRLDPPAVMLDGCLAFTAAPSDSARWHHRQRAAADARGAL